MKENNIETNAKPLVLVGLNPVTLVKMFTVNTPLIITGQAIAIKAFVDLMERAHVARRLTALPSPITHHSAYATEFKGAMIEKQAPVVIVQNQEYCDIITQIPDEDPLSLINYNFNIVQLSLLDEELTATVYTKQQYKQLRQDNPTWDFRD